MNANGLAKFARQLAFNAQRYATTCGAPSVGALKSDDVITKPFLYRDMKIELAPLAKRTPIPKVNEIRFGYDYSDHMFEVHWNSSKGWGTPLINPLHRLNLHPGCKVLHYAIELFEGMKAFRGVDNKIRLFRPEMNMERMRRTALRSALPDFSSEELLKIICELVKIDQEWVPYAQTCSLYIRPSIIATDEALGIGHPNDAMLFVITLPATQFFLQKGLQPISLLADPQYVRAFPGGVGSFKMGCNYAPSMAISKMAAKMGCQQVLWLYGQNEDITEVGTMNILVYWKNEQGEDELVSPPLDKGIILPGINRDTILSLGREWNQFKVSERFINMHEIRKAIAENRMYEMFGAGTACVIAPVGRILYRNQATNEYEELMIPTMEHKPNLVQKVYDTIMDIQYGRVEHPTWTKVIN